MIVMSVARKHGGEIVQRSLASVARVHRRSVGRMASDHVASLEHGSGQRPCRGRLCTDETSSYSKHAADSVGEFTREISEDLIKFAVLEPEIGARVIVGERLSLALLDSEREQIGRILSPVDVPDRIDTILGEHDGAKVLGWACLVTDGDSLAAQRFQASNVGSVGAEKPNAAAVHAGGDSNIEALLQRLEPAQCHPDARVRF